MRRFRVVASGAEKLCALGARAGPLRGPSTSPLEAAARNDREMANPICEELAQRTFDRRRSLCARGGGRHKPPPNVVPAASVCAR